MATAELVERKSGDVVDQVGAISNLPPQLAIMKMEMDAIQSLAAARPRDMAKIKAELSSMLDAFPEMANEAIYNKPVGKVQLIDCYCGYQYEATSNKQEDMLCPSCGKVDIKEQRKIQKYARGLSIKAAETLAEVYGFNGIKGDVAPVDADTVKVIGVFVDFQKGTRREYSSLVSRFYKSRGGTMTRIAEDRFMSMNVKSEQSKVVREAVTRSINAGLKSWFFDQCDKIQDTLLNDEAVAKIVGQFSTKNVSLEMIEGLLGRAKSAGWTVDDRKTLVGVWNALKTGESTVQELFRPDDDETPKPSAPKGPVTATSFTSPKAAPKSEEKPPSNPAPTTKPAEKDVAPAAGSLLLQALDDAKSAEEIHSILEDVSCALAEKRLPADEAAGLKEYGREKLAAISAHADSEGDQSGESRFERLKALFERATTDEQRMAAWKGAVVAANDKLVSPEQYKILVSLNGETRKRLGSSAR